MIISNILKIWGIAVPTNVWFMEHLIEIEPNKIFFIDRFPLKVGLERRNKFDQMDIEYNGKYKTKKIENAFHNLEIKYKSTLIMFWLFSKTYIEYDIETKNIKFTERKKIQHLLKEYPQNKITDKIELKNDLETFIEFGVRDQANITLYFEDFEMILSFARFGCALLYLHNINRLEDIKAIVNTEGLYLRSKK